MTQGHEYLTQIHEPLREFEEAVVQREKFKPFESKLARQQDVDHKRQKVVDAVVKIVTAERMKKRGMVILLSDLLDQSDNLTSGLQHLRHKKHEILAFHIMDKYELTFPFESMTLFEGLEEYPELLADPRALKKAYLSELDKFLNDLKKGCRNNRVDYVQLHTGMPLDVALTRYLAMRSARVSKGGTGGNS